MSDQIPVERLRALTEAAAAVVGTAQLENLLGTLVETARETTGARYAALGVIGEHKTLIEFVHRGIDATTTAMIGHLPEGRGVLGTLIRDRETIRLERISDHPDSVGFPDHHPEMETFLGVPVGTAEEAFGNLYLTEKEGGFTEEDEFLVGALAAIAGAAVETTRLRSRLAHLAVLDDRQRIGRDLHDSIIQDLFATGLELQALAERLGPGEPSDLLDRTVDRLDRTIESLRRIVSDLSSATAGSPFAERLRALTSQLARPYESAIAIAVDPPGLDLDPQVAEQILPMVGEAVSNALRHSGSEVVEVSIELLDESLLIAVTDQGSGFDPNTVTRGMGLGNLEARVSRLGGQLSLRSVIGAGTVVEVVLPVA